MADIFLPIENLGHNRVAAFAASRLLELLGTFLPRPCQIGQQPGVFLPVLGLRLVGVLNQLFRFSIVDAGNFEILFGRGAALEGIDWLLCLRYDRCWLLRIDRRRILMRGFRHIHLLAGACPRSDLPSANGYDNTPVLIGDERIFLSYGCKIAHVSTPIELVSTPQKEKRNWLPLLVATAIVLSIAAAALLLNLRQTGSRSNEAVAPINAPLDPYAANLPLTGLAMSESANLAGGKVTYLDGTIANTGSRTVTSVTVQVLFRDAAQEVAQNENQPLRLIRAREPSIDVEPLSAAPLKPGDSRPFRLVFDSVKPDWDGAYPEIRILHVETR